MLSRDACHHLCAQIVITVVIAATPRWVSAQLFAVADGALHHASGAQASSRPSTGFFVEPTFISKPIDFVVDRFAKAGEREKSGFYPEFSNQATGAGWVSAGPGYRRYLLDDQLFVDGSATVSWHMYKMAQVRIELPALLDDRLTIGTQAMWQDLTQVSYFGAGPDSLESDRSEYRIRTTDVVGYLNARPNEWLTFGGKFGWLKEPTLGPPAGTFGGDFPDTRVVFADQPGASLARQPRYLHGQADVTSDTRDHRGHPTSGELYRAGLTIYRDQAAGTFSFTEYQLEGLQLVPLSGSRWVLALRGWAVLTDVPSGHEVPIYLQPTIGGHNTLRSYRSYRFHDRNALVANAESRWAIYTHVDLAAFVDAGNVAATVGGLNLDKTSYGAGIRLHTGRATLARADVAHGAEGWRIFFRTGDALRLGRLTRRIAALPFAP
jgi:surface antigen Omp85-like protein